MGRLILVAGENSSGKSVYAEGLVCRTALKRFYIATMIPATDENNKRIEKHRVRRKDMGFTTFEKGSNIRELPVGADSVVLLEDVSNLLVNFIFIEKKDINDAYEDIAGLVSKCGVCIAVTISRFDFETDDPGTKDYMEQMEVLNRRLFELADAAVLMKDGKPEVIKGEIEGVI